jgi:transposase
MAKVDGRGMDHKTLEHLRILAVKRVVEDGEAPSGVMQSLGFSRTAIYPWLRKFEEEGWDSLMERIAKGPEPKLTEKQRQQVKRWIIGKDPRQHGLDYGLWSRGIVQTLLKERMSIELGLTSVGRLLASLDITPQKPLRRVYERDRERVKDWLEERYPMLKKRAKKLSAKIFFLDEAEFLSDPVLGRTYGLKGKTPVVKTSGQRESINVISTVNASGEFWAATYDGRLNGESFVQFLKDFMKTQQGNKVFLVLDGLAVHKAKTVTSYVEGLEGRLELHSLPP